MKEPLNTLNSPNLKEHTQKLETLKPATLRIPLNKNRKPIPQPDCKVSAGTVVITNNEPELIADYIYAPWIGYVDGMVEVKGESMEPTYINGSRVAIIRMNDYRILNWGQCYYILDRNLQSIIRRVYESEKLNSIKLVSDYYDQRMFPPFYRSWDEVLAIFRITACIIKQ